MKKLVGNYLAVVVKLCFGVILSLGIVSKAYSASKPPKASANSGAGGSSGASASANASSTPKPVDSSTPSSSGSSTNFDFFKPNGNNEVDVSGTFGSFDSFKAGSIMRLRGTYLYLVKPQLQAGLELLFDNYSVTGASHSAFGFYGRVAYNLDPSGLANSLYVFGALGFLDPAVEIGGVSQSKSEMCFKIGVGKRFPFVGNVSFKPEAMMLKLGSSDPGFRVVPLNFGIAW